MWAGGRVAAPCRTLALSRSAAARPPAQPLAPERSPGRAVSPKGLFFLSATAGSQRGETHSLANARSFVQSLANARSFAGATAPAPPQFGGNRPRTPAKPPSHPTQRKTAACALRWLGLRPALYPTGAGAWRFALPPAATRPRGRAVGGYSPHIFYCCRLESALRCLQCAATLPVAAHRGRQQELTQIMGYYDNYHYRLLTSPCRSIVSHNIHYLLPGYRARRPLARTWLDLHRQLSPLPSPRWGEAPPGRQATLGGSVPPTAACRPPTPKI